MSSRSIFTDDAVVTDLPGFWSTMAHAPRATVQDFPSDLAERVADLTPVEVATIRCVVPKLNNVPPEFLLLSRAAAFLAVWERRGILRYMSGKYIAQQLTAACFSGHPFHIRSGKRGLQLLADLDSAELGVEVWCSTLRPDPPGLDRYERVRLSERLRELPLS